MCACVFYMCACVRVVGGGGVGYEMTSLQSLFNLPPESGGDRRGQRISGAA